jgi:esterase
MQLNFKVFGDGYPLIILHGLLGSLDNWQTIAKRLSDKFQVFILDQRNHGKSPHSDEFSYEILSNDLFDFLQQHQISKAHIIGHSMGGKTAMQFALDHSERVDKLVVVDIAPVTYDDENNPVFKALFGADVKHAASREEIEMVLQKSLKDEATVQFLMKGLQRAVNGQSAFQWRFNVESLYENFSLISSAINSSKVFSGEVLFIKGGESPYINPDNYSAIEKLFPKHQITEIKGAGHWVHADKPAEFIAEVTRFLS